LKNCNTGISKFHGLKNITSVVQKAKPLKELAEEA
jgi:hypothetical protein